MGAGERGAASQPPTKSPHQTRQPAHPRRVEQIRLGNLTGNAKPQTTDLLRGEFKVAKIETAHQFSRRKLFLFS